MAAMSRPAQPAMISAWMSTFSDVASVWKESFIRPLQVREKGCAAVQKQITEGWRRGETRCVVLLNSKGQTVERHTFLMKTITRKLAANSNAATKYKPDDSEPVLVLSAPIMYGATKPARLTIELISAMPPAAAVLARKAAGIDQNTGKAARMPIAASVSAHSAMTALPSVRPVRIRPTLAMSVAMALCMRRSPVLSEWMPFQIMANVPAMKGMAEIRPICKLPLMPISLMIDGVQKAMVALPLTTQKYTAAHSQTR